MRYPASEKLEIISLVEGSHLPVKRTLEKLGVSRPTFYRWYDRFLQLGEAGLEDRKSHPGRVWNRIPDTVRQAMLEMALARPELSPRELAVTFTEDRLGRICGLSSLARRKTTKFRPLANLAPLQKNNPIWHRSKVLNP